MHFHEANIPRFDILLLDYCLDCSFASRLLYIYAMLVLYNAGVYCC